jgi:hypothetical protein
VMHGGMTLIGDGEIVKADQIVHASATAQPMAAQSTAMPTAT